VELAEGHGEVEAVHGHGGVEALGEPPHLERGWAGHGGGGRVVRDVGGVHAREGHVQVSLGPGWRGSGSPTGSMPLAGAVWVGRHRGEHVAVEGPCPLWSRPYPTERPPPAPVGRTATPRSRSRAGTPPPRSGRRGRRRGCRRARRAA